MRQAHRKPPKTLSDGSDDKIPIRGRKWLAGANKGF
nr:MAG TPA: hypothetical protein [Caudoviricetes sp.]